MGMKNDHSCECSICAERYEALTALLKLYVELAESGDAGFWDPEKVPEVIAARATLRHGH